MFDFLNQYTVTADGAGKTPTTADQLLSQITIPEQKGFTHFLVHFDIEVAMVSSPVVQQLDLELVNDAASDGTGGTVVKTFHFSPGAVDVVGIQNVSITHPVPRNSKGNITLRLGNAGAADVDTTLIVKNVWVAGLSGIVRA